MLLKRVTYPYRLSDMTPRFGRPVAVIRLITNDVIGDMESRSSEPRGFTASCKCYIRTRRASPISSMGLSDPFRDLNVRELFIMAIRGSTP